MKTNEFNAAREAARKPVSSDWLIVTLHEGMKLDCGCEVVTANGHDYTERHWRDTCTLKSIKWAEGETQRKIKVGDGKHIAGTIVDKVGKVFASCDPSKGLWPHEL